ncbi:MAG: FAD-binding protein [Ruminococcus sp.]|nr:FAD-binding protein [Ruminococcus sp.]
MNTKYHVIIAGAGVAGLYSALCLPEDVTVLLLSKQKLDVCNSTLAQGGIAAVYNPPDDDSFNLHYHDSLRAGGFKNNPETLWKLVSDAPRDIERVIGFGVDFDKDTEGNYHRTLEGGHCRRRIFHYKDSSGNEVTSRLREQVLARRNITVMPEAELCNLKCTHTGFSADVLFVGDTAGGGAASGGIIPANLQGGHHETFDCAYFILATGGIGRVFERTTNASIATGDGICIAYELGAKIKNLSYIQFHPTAFYDRGGVDNGGAAKPGLRECFLISESVRGEGAYLINRDGRRFMADYDPERMELAPRDVVSHAIISEAKKLSSDEFYLDISHKPADFIREHFPAINKFLLSKGIDMTTDKIPIYPCHHYLMGGINVDVTGQTSVNRLYACGECAHTGVHGQNRLASNSLIEALVFGRSCAEQITKRLREKPVNPEKLASYRFLRRYDAKPIPVGLRTKIRRIMQNACFVFPDMAEVKRGLPEVTRIKEDLENGNYIVDANYVEAKSLATVAYLILREII